MNYSNLVQGMQGKKQAIINTPMGMGTDMAGFRNPMKFSKYETAPAILPDNLDYSTRYEPKSCYDLVTNVIRQDNPVPASNCYQAPMGIGRGQDKGLAYTVRLDAPIMKKTHSVFPNRLSHL